MQASTSLLLGSYDGGIVYKDTQIATQNPSYCLINGRYLIAVIQSDNGYITWFDMQNGFKNMGKLSTQGASPCHLAIDKTKRMLFVANYSSSTVAIFLIGTDGQPQTLLQVLRHTGSGPNPDRQAQPHPHCTAIDYDNRTAFISDLGTDHVYWYDLDVKLGSVQMKLDRSIKLDGVGPRHLALGKQSDRTLYLSCELKSCVIGMNIGSGKLIKLFQVDTAVGPVNYPSEIKHYYIGSDEFLAVAGRGDDNVVILRLVSGKPEPWMTFKVGNWPRHFNLNAAKNLLAVACQRSNQVIEFSINGQKATETRRISLQAASFIEYLE